MPAGLGGGLAQGLAQGYQLGQSFKMEQQRLAQQQEQLDQQKDYHAAQAQESRARAKKFELENAYMQQEVGGTLQQLMRGVTGGHQFTVNAPGGRVESFSAGPPTMSGEAGLRQQMRQQGASPTEMFSSNQAIQGPPASMPSSLLTPIQPVPADPNFPRGGAYRGSTGQDPAMIEGPGIRPRLAPAPELPRPAQAPAMASGGTLQTVLEGLTPQQQAQVKLSMFGPGGSFDAGMRLAASFKERPLHWVSDAVTGEHIGLDAHGKEVIRAGGTKPEKEEKPSVAPIDTETADLSDGKFRTYDAAMSAGVAGDKQALTWAKQANKNVKLEYGLTKSREQGLTTEQLHAGRGVEPERTKNYFDRNALLMTGRLVAPKAGQAISETEARSNKWVVVTDKDKDDLKTFYASKSTNALLFKQAKQLITATTPQEALKQYGRLHLAAATGSNPVAAAYKDGREAFSSSTARSVGLERGVLTNQDVTRWAKTLASFGDTVGTLKQKEQIFNEVLRFVEEGIRRSIVGDNPRDEASVTRLEQILSRADTLDKLTKRQLPQDVIDAYIEERYGKSGTK